MISITANLTIERLYSYALDFWINYGGYISLFLTLSIVLLVFWILLGGKYEDKRRLAISFGLIIFGLFLTIASPFSRELNSVMIAVLFSPLIAYIIGFLKANKKFSDEIDKASQEYRWKQVERESDIIGELLGELSTHAAAFKSYGIREIGFEKWNKSFKVGLISDIHTFLVARYYYFVPMYNNIVEDLSKLMEQEEVNKLKDCSESFAEVKKAFFETETSIYHTLIYDLGLLQQKYLSRPTVQFPLHMNLLLRKRLKTFGILEKGHEIAAVNVFSQENLERFNRKMGKHLNSCYANMGIKIKTIEKKISEVQKTLSAKQK